MNISIKTLLEKLRGQKKGHFPWVQNNLTELEWLNKYTPLVGEFAWHTLTLDTTIDSVSAQHFRIVSERIDKYALRRPINILEIGAYAHSAGYTLQERYGAEVTLFDLSQSTLRLGRDRLATKNDNVELVAGDFHALPFTDNYFDVVYIFAALHHSKDFKQVLSETHRVMAPNGLLCVFQEPFKREACFYQFRTNRLDKLTDFEKALEAEGILTTVAEPAPGSRDEILFGMIENQEIPLQDWIRCLCGAHCAPLELSPHYAGKVGELGKMWLSWGREDGTLFDLSQKMAGDFGQRLGRVRPAFDEQARGLGFSLPETDEIKAKFDFLATQILSLPSANAGPEYDLQVAKLFGGALSFVGRKHWDAVIRENKSRKVKFLQPYPLVDGVRVAFPEDSLGGISPSKSCIPAFDCHGHRPLQDIFPPPAWALAKQENGFWALSLTSSCGEIVLPANKGLMLLMLRINLIYGLQGEPYRLKIVYDEKEFVHPVYQDDAILFRGVVGAAGPEQKRIMVVTETLGDRPHQFYDAGLVKIYYAGAFPLQDVITFSTF